MIWFWVWDCVLIWVVGGDSGGSGCGRWSLVAVSVGSGGG